MPFYAVHKGKSSPAIYDTWPECKRQVEGMVGAVYKKFDSYSDAQKFMQEGFGDSRKPRGFQKAESTLAPQRGDGAGGSQVASYEAKNQDEIDTVFSDANAHRNLIIYTDGSCLREGDKVYCGYGIVIPELGIKYSSDLDDRRRTNNRAEMRAILHAVEMVGDELRASRRLCIFTDSQYCKYIFQGTGARYERDGFMKEGKEVPNRDMIEVVLRYLRTNEIAILKVRAHTDATDIHSRYNSLADGLANEGSLKQKMGKRYVPNPVITGTPVFHDSVLHPFERRIPQKATTPQIEDPIHQELIAMDPLSAEPALQRVSPGTQITPLGVMGAMNPFGVHLPCGLITEGVEVDPQVAHRYTKDKSWREEEKRRLQGKTGSRQILDFFLDGGEEEVGPPAPAAAATPKPKAKVVAKVKGNTMKTYKSTRLDDFLKDEDGDAPRSFLPANTRPNLLFSDDD